SYGRLVVYNFPKQKNVYGPRLIDARIDQDPIISQQLSLWNQRGSTVIRGSLLAIPIEQSLIYVQPLYLAAEQGALPELRRVIVALALGPAFRRAGWPARVWWAAAICAAVPDADVLGVFAGVPLGSLLGHRGLTHSLAFAAALAAIVTPLLVAPGTRRRLWVYLFLATASHGIPDGMTDGGIGVAYFAPFDAARYYLPW